MKRFISLSLLSVLMMVSMPQKSHALVGLLVKKKTVAMVGGATTGVGVLSIYLTSTATTLGSALGFIMVGLGLGALGIIVLDDDTAEFKFPVMTDEKAAKLGVSNFEMDKYNSELNKLNRVKELVEEGITSKSSIADARDVWTNTCTNFLSEVTCSVKALVAKDFMDSIQTNR